MTNYCSNRLEIRGSAEDVARFGRACLTESRDAEPPGLPILDFPRILPPPNPLEGEAMQNWALNEWGATPDRIEYDAAILEDHSYSASFISPHAAPESIIHAIAHQFPQLTIRFVAVEEGNEYCFELDSRDGVMTSGNPELTDALIEEVEGEGEVARRMESEVDFWSEASSLRTSSLIKGPRPRLRDWFAERKLRKALSVYPIYSPPHRGLPALGSQSQADDNFAYFWDQKDARIDALRAFLKKFGVALAFDETANAGIDQWLYRYGGLLHVDETRPSIYTHSPIWDGARRSLNVVFDISVYLGEFALRETPGLSWGLDEHNKPQWGTIFSSYRRPVLTAPHSVFGDRFPRDLLEAVQQFCSVRSPESQSRNLHFRSFYEGAGYRSFLSTTLRDIRLRAGGEIARADEEWNIAHR